MLCAGCREKIESFYLFRKQCQSNDEYIRRKRSNWSIGTEFERKDTGLQLASVKEPEVDALLKEVKDIFGSAAVEKQEDPEDIKMPDLAPAVIEHEIIEVPSSSGQSNESFCGFSVSWIFSYNTCWAYFGNHCFGVFNLKFKYYSTSFLFTSWKTTPDDRREFSSKTPSRKRPNVSRNRRRRQRFVSVEFRSTN